jgi:D-alanyl-D-alanine carboxypeptidase (penicillin-binding protein 5/6)
MTVKKSKIYGKTTGLVFLIICLWMFGLTVRAEEPTDLYARSAVLMDADTGRILFEKNGQEKLPMASTTKIMTLLVTLENADLDGIVEVSSYAASMPDVQLNIRAGEKYRLYDLCYSLMLESHNDTAVAIAEHVGGSVEGFAAMMNQKARDLGCYDTYFITPNGLDASDDRGTHSTTAADLARIMRCCMQNETFLTITRASSWSFCDLDGTRNFTVNNKNAFLNMMDGALTGKTGFTGNAGYCYVGALERDGKRLIAVVLACGWPNHKTWKWSDTQKLMNYGLTDFQKKSVGETELRTEPVRIQNGQKDWVATTVKPEILELLMADTDNFTIKVEQMESLEAPVKAGTIVGSVSYLLNGKILKIFPICLTEEVEAVDYFWCMKKIFCNFLTHML